MDPVLTTGAKNYRYTDIIIAEGCEASNCVGSSLVLNSGENASGVMVSGGEFRIGSGASAENTMMNTGSMYVEKGGFASDTEVMDWSSQYILGTASDTTVSAHTGSAIQHIGPGGFAHNTTVAYGGRQLIASGGVTSNTMITSGGYQFVFTGGKAYSVMICSQGTQVVSSGAFAATVLVYGSQVVSAGAVVSSGIISGASAQQNILGGSAYGFDVSSGGRQNLTAGLASGTRIYKGGRLVVSGGSAVSATVSSGGGLEFSGGVVTGLKQEVGGTLKIYLSSGGGGSINGTNASGTFSFDGTKASNFIIYSSGVLYLGRGRTAYNTVVSAGGSHYINGGTGSSGRIYADGLEYVGGGVAFGTVISSGGEQLLYGGAASGSIICAGGSQFVAETGIAYDTIVSAGGELWVGDPNYKNDDVIPIYLDCGSAFRTVLMSGGKLYVASGQECRVDSLVQSEGGILNIMVGDETTVIRGTNESGAFFVSGGVASNTIIYSGGVQGFWDSGTANKTVVSSGGKLAANGVLVYLSGLTVHSGGIADVTNSRISGVISFGATMTNFHAVVNGSATINLLVNERSTSDAAILSGSSVIARSANYSVTVSSSQKSGSYKLAAGDAIFDGGITVYSTSGTKLGTLKIDGKLESGGNNYTLTVSNNTLLFTVNGSESDIEGDFTCSATPDTKYNATLSWTFTGKAASYEITLDGEKVLKSSKTSLKVSSLTPGNHYFTVRAVSSTQTYSAWSTECFFTVGDYTIPTVSGKATVNGYSVTFALSGKDNVGVTKYVVSCGGKSVTTENGSATLTDFGVGKFTAEVIAYDAAGNASKTGKISFTVKDATPPEQVVGL
ncbi:MAG: AIDA repeat-containing protein, partial [Victivallaceae bacterium]|nr:AIDA repeat-containing protein [Victivallaceae bacterium]